jgi:exodeoxyribonuclease VII large subunit
MPTDVTPAFTVSDFVAVCNQTLEFAYPNVVIEGELANFRVSRNKWVYFDLKDDDASVRFFGTVYNLQGPLEDGMVLRVRGVPRLHPQYGFSLTVLQIQPVGEGTIRRAADLLQAKLAAEGLFEPDRKRLLPYPPERIGLITSGESAAYADFMKILNARWRGMEVMLADVQVQGEAAITQLVAAVEMFNQLAQPPEVLIVTRGGGSAEDLQAFSSEQVTRAVASSRIPTLVAVGHEIDVSLAELAADQRASTPSNAAELLVPDRGVVLNRLGEATAELETAVSDHVQAARLSVQDQLAELHRQVLQLVRTKQEQLAGIQQVLAALNPAAVLARGYAIVKYDGRTVRSAGELQKNAIVELQFNDGRRSATVD